MLPDEWDNRAKRYGITLSPPSAKADTPTNTSSQGWWTPDRVKQATTHLQQNAGLSPRGAHGLVSRWAGVEAAGGPDSVNPSSGAFGIGQWLGSRKNGVPKDFEGQLNHAVRELNISESASAKRLRNAQTDEDAAIGASMFERAEGYNPKTGRDNFVLKTIDIMKRLGMPSVSPEINFDALTERYLTPSKETDFDAVASKYLGNTQSLTAPPPNLASPMPSQILPDGHKRLQIPNQPLTPDTDVGGTPPVVNHPNAAIAGGTAFQQKSTYTKRDTSKEGSYYDFEKTGKSDDLDYLGMSGGKHYAKDNDGGEYELEEKDGRGDWKTITQSHTDKTIDELTQIGLASKAGLKEYDTWKITNPSGTSEQFNAANKLEFEAAQAKSKADWLAKTPKGYAKDAADKGLDPHDPKTIADWNKRHKTRVKTPITQVVAQQLPNTSTDGAESPETQTDTVYYSKGKPENISARQWITQDIAAYVAERYAPTEEEYTPIFKATERWIKQNGIATLDTQLNRTDEELAEGYKQGGGYYQLNKTDIDSILGIVDAQKENQKAADEDFTERSKSINPNLDATEKEAALFEARMLADANVGLVTPEQAAEAVDKFRQDTKAYKEDRGFLNIWNEDEWAKLKETVMNTGRGSRTSEAHGELPESTVPFKSQRDFFNEAYEAEKKQYGNISEAIDARRRFKERFKDSPNLFIFKTGEAVVGGAMKVPFEMAASALETAAIAQEAGEAILGIDGDATRKTSYKLGQDLRKLVEGLPDADFKGGKAEMFGNVVGQVVLQTVAGIATGGALTPALMGASQGVSGAYKDATEHTATQWERLGAAVFGGIVEIPDYFIFKGILKGGTSVKNAAFLGRFRTTIERGLEKALGKPLAEKAAVSVTDGLLAKLAAQTSWKGKLARGAQVAGRQTKYGLLEGGQESGAKAGNDLIAYLTYDPSAERAARIFSADTLTEGVMGFFGGLIGASIADLNIRAKSLSPEAIKESKELLETIKDELPSETYEDATKAIQTAGEVSPTKKGVNKADAGEALIAETAVPKAEKPKIEPKVNLESNKGTLTPASKLTETNEAVSDTPIKIKEVAAEKPVETVKERAKGLFKPRVKVVVDEKGKVVVDDKPAEADKGLTGEDFVSEKDFNELGYGLPSGLKNRGVTGLKSLGNNRFDVKLENGQTLSNVLIHKSVAKGFVIDNQGLLSPSNTTQIAYDGKMLEVNVGFKQAAMRVADNLKTGDTGYVKTPDGKVYEISGSSKKAKLMPERLAQPPAPQVADKPKQTSFDQTDLFGNKVAPTTSQPEMFNTDTLADDAKKAVSEDLEKAYGKKTAGYVNELQESKNPKIAAIAKELVTQSKTVTAKGTKHLVESAANALDLFTKAEETNRSVAEAQKQPRLDDIQYTDKEIELAKAMEIGVFPAVFRDAISNAKTPVSIKPTSLDFSPSGMKMFRKPTNQTRLRKEGFEFKRGMGKRNVVLTKAPEGFNPADFETRVYETDNQRSNERQIGTSKPTKSKPYSLSQAIRAAGGVKSTKYEKGEVKRLSNKETGSSGLVSVNGMFPERMAEQMWEVGYLRNVWETAADISGPDLMSFAEDDLRGIQKYYPQGEMEDVNEEGRSIAEQETLHIAQQQKQADIESRLQILTENDFTPIENMNDFFNEEEVMIHLLDAENQGELDSQTRQKLVRIGTRQYDINKAHLEKALNLIVLTGRQRQKTIAKANRQRGDARQGETDFESQFYAQSDLDDPNNPLNQPPDVEGDPPTLAMSVGGETANFKNWFGDSKVVDDKGNPLVVYHGTADDFDIFQPTPSKRTTALGSLRDVTSPAFFFASKQSTGDMFGRNRADYKYDRPWKGKTMEVFLRMERPLDLSRKNDATINKLKKIDIDLYKHFGHKFQSYVDADRSFNLDANASDFWYVADKPELVEKIKAAGYDGIIFNEGRHTGDTMDNDGRKGRGLSYAVFEPTQIKSAIGNNGEYSTENDSILKKVPDADLAAELQTYADIDLFDDENLAKSKVTVKGDTITASMMANELMRTARAFATGADRAKQGKVAGETFLKPETVKELITTFNQMAESAVESDYDPKPFTDIAEALQKAYDAKDGRVAWALPIAETHEQLHLADQRAAEIVDDKGNKVVLDFEKRNGSAFKTLTDPTTSAGKAFAKFSKKFNEISPGKPAQVQIAEAFAYLSDESASDFGLTHEEAVEILATIVEGRAEAIYNITKSNAAVRRALAHFNIPEAVVLTKAIEAYYEKNDTKTESISDGKDNENRIDSADQEREAGREDTTREVAEDGQGIEEESAGVGERTAGLKDILDDTRIKHRQYAETLRENGRDAYQNDVEYVPESEKGWTDNARGIIERSFDTDPQNPFAAAIKTFNSKDQPESFRAVLGTALIDHLGAAGEYDQMRTVGDDTVTIVGTAGQTLRASQVMSKYDFAKGIEIGIKGMKKLGKDLTNEQIEDIKKKTGRFAAASDKDAMAASMLEEANAELETVNQEIDALQGMYNQLSEINKVTTLTLEQTKKQATIFKRLATFYKNKLGKDSQSRTRVIGSKVLRQDLALTQDADLAVFNDAFGISTLSMAVPNSDPMAEKHLPIEQRKALVRQAQRWIVAADPKSYANVLQGLTDITHGKVSKATIKSIHAEAVKGIAKDPVVLDTMTTEARTAYETAKKVRKIRSEHRTRARQFEQNGDATNGLSPLNHKIIEKIADNKQVSPEDKEKLMTATMLLMTARGAKAWNAGFTEAYGGTQSENDHWFKQAVETRDKLRKEVNLEMAQKRADKKGWTGSIDDFNAIAIDAQRAKRDAKNSLDSHYKELQKALWEKVIDGILFPFRLMRTAMSTGEVSQIGRQGYPTLLTFPKVWGRSLKGIQMAFQDPNKRFAVIKAIEESPRFKESVKYKMPYASFGENSVGDEHFPIDRAMTRLRDRDYKISKIPVLGAMMSNAAKLQQRFEHAYTDPADLQRYGVYSAFADIIDGQGLTDAQTDRAKKRAVYYAQILSGKGSLPKLLGENSFVSKMLADLGFAPNLLASRFETAFHFNPVIAPILAPKGLKGTMFKKSLQLYAIPMLLAVALGAIFKPDDDDEDVGYLDIINPKSKNFMKLKIRGTDINLDVSGGMSEFQRLMFWNWTNLIYSAATEDQDGFVRTAKALAQNEKNTFANTRFWRGKFSPGASLAVDIGSGSDFLGHPINWQEGGYWGAVTNRMAPITYQNIYKSLHYSEARSLTKEPQTFNEAMKNVGRMDISNVPTSLLLGTLEAVGLSATQYEKNNGSIAEDVAWTMWSNKYEAKDPRLARVRTTFRKLFVKQNDLMERGKSTVDVDKTINELKTKYADMPNKMLTEAVKQAKQGTFEFVTKDFNVEQMQRILMFATENEKQELEKILNKKSKKENKSKKLAGRPIG